MDKAGVFERNGKCLIRWREGAKNRQITLDIPYSKTGIERAWKIREQHIRAFKRGDREIGKAPTFAELSQIRLDTASLAASTRRTQLIYLNKYWSPVFHVPVSEIQYADLLEMFGTLDKAPKTIKHILSAGSQVFELAIKSGYRQDNPAKVYARDIKLVRKTADPFTKEEREMILDDLKDHQHLFYLIRFYCGLRPSEAIALRWSDYREVEGPTKTKVKSKVFHVVKGRYRSVEGPTKTRVERVVPVHPRVREALRKIPRQLHDDHIIVNQYGRGYTNADRLANAFRRSLKRLNIRYRSPYNCRHTCATMMLEAGMKPGYAAKVMGHSLEMFFRIYADWIDRDESEIQAQIWSDIE